MDYRNRYRIATAAGPQLLSIPIMGGRRQQASLDKVYIDYTHAWQRQHWRTLLSAYGRAPFFEHYAPMLESLILAAYPSLLDFNLASIAWLNKEMQVNQSLPIISNLSAEAESYHMVDTGSGDNVRVYHQVFEDRYGFLPNLSAIDLLMNEGPYSTSLL
jgi:hypothetical protein